MRSYISKYRKLHILENIQLFEIYLDINNTFYSVWQERGDKTISEKRLRTVNFHCRGPRFDHHKHELSR